jgi:hypothetical protein
MTFDFQQDFETVAIRKWKGGWAKGCPLPPIDRPAGGYVVTFHRGTQPPYKAEHYASVERIVNKYPQYAWLSPMPGDPDDLVLVGV